MSHPVAGSLCDIATTIPTKYRCRPAEVHRRGQIHVSIVVGCAPDRDVDRPTGTGARIYIARAGHSSFVQGLIAISKIIGDLAIWWFGVEISIGLDGSIGIT